MNPYYSNELRSWQTWCTLAPYLMGSQSSDEFWNAFSADEDIVEEGAQAMVGVVYKGAARCIYKISQYEDYTVHHEYRVLRALNQHLHWLPYIPKVYGLIPYTGFVDPNEGMNGSIEPRITRYALLMEEVQHVCNLSKFIKTKSARLIVAVLKQLLLCIRILRRQQATHYDLHTDNVLIRKCPDNLVIQYQNYTIRTFGYMPVIIDYGFAHAENIEGSGEPLYVSLYSVVHGYMSDRYMPFADYIRLSYSMAQDLKTQYNKDKLFLSKKLRGLFAKCETIMIDNGWETSDAPDYIDEIYEKINIKLYLLNDIRWLSILTSLLPQKLGTPAGEFNKQPFHTFARVWQLIEKRVTHQPLLNYLFRYLVQTIRMHVDHREIKAIFMDEFTRVVNSYVPTLDFSILVYAVKSMARNLHILLAHYLNKRERELRASYTSLPFTEKTCDDYIWNIIEQVYGQDECLKGDETFLISESQDQGPLGVRCKLVV